MKNVTYMTTGSSATIFVNGGMVCMLKKVGKEWQGRFRGASLVGTLKAIVRQIASIA